MRLTKHSTLAVLSLSLVAGCIEGRSALSPNRDTSLRKPTKAFIADAKGRQYPSTAPVAGKAPMRAEVDYSLKLINMVNLGDSEWDNAEMWVNGKYVCYLQHIEPRIEKTVNFQILIDNEGVCFPTKLQVEQVKKVELLHDGKLYEVPLFLAD